MPEPLAHWRGLDRQVVLEPGGVRHPTRCGLFDDTAMLGWPLEYVTCPKCRDLAMADSLRTQGQRPLRVWSRPSSRAAYGRYWWWECRLCDYSTRNLIPLPGVAHDCARAHLTFVHGGNDD